jgi:hypothetical protein
VVEQPRGKFLTKFKDMRRVFMLFVAVMFLGIASYGQGTFDQWPEMKTFHNTLSQTFHPAEEGDLKPIKTRSHELYANCKLINASHLPLMYDKEEIVTTLKRLEQETDKLNALIVIQEQSATIMKQLNIVHNTFHEIVGMCKKEGKQTTKK